MFSDQDPGQRPGEPSLTTTTIPRLFYLCKRPRELSSAPQGGPAGAAPEIVEVSKQD